MTVRKIVEIDEEKCDGCGQCIPSCAEGAIELVDGKARVVSDVYCDGLGACLGTCPQDAIRVIDREAEAFDLQKAHEHVARREQERQAAAPPLPNAHGAACPGSMARRLAGGATPPLGGCPGALARELEGKPSRAEAPASGETPSELRNWPLQLHLVPPSAPYLQGADLLLAADCVAFAYPDFHARMLRGKRLVIGCPKLDDTSAYREKLAAIFRQNDIRSLEIVRMEVPCCGGLVHVARLALADSGKELPVRVTVVGISGEIMESAELEPAPAAR